MDELRERIAALEAEQMECLAIMAHSDVYASKCVKLGVIFAEAYPQQYSEYIEANTRYNANQGLLEGLCGQLEDSVEDRVENFSE